MHSDVVWASIHEGFIEDSRLTDAPRRPTPRTPHVHRENAPDGNMCASGAPGQG